MQFLKILFLVVTILLTYLYKLKRSAALDKRWSISPSFTVPEEQVIVHYSIWSEPESGPKSPGSIKEVILPSLQFKLKDE
jgi:hypothetical protein